MSMDPEYDCQTNFSITRNPFQRTFFPYFEVKFNFSLYEEFVDSTRDLPLPYSHHRATARVIVRDQLSFDDVKEAVETAIGGNLPSEEHSRMISLAWELVKDFVGPTGIVPLYVELDVDLEVWILFSYVSGDDSGSAMVPAAEEDIRLLEECEAAEEEESCSICLEELSAALRMPCSHMFHRECIQTWLRKSRCCPLCRFPMPTATN